MAQVYLGHYLSKGSEQNVPLAAHYFESAAKAKNYEGMVGLAGLHDRGLVPGGASNPSYAQQLIKEAASGGHPRRYCNPRRAAHGWLFGNSATSKGS